MTLTAFFLVVTAAFCHATWNFLVKKLHAGPELLWLFSLITLLIYSPFAIWVGIHQYPFAPEALLFLLGSAILHLGYLLLLQWGYRKGDLSVVYPTARATGPLISSGLAIAFLGENLTPQIALGGGIIIFGVFMLTGSFRTSSRQALISVGFGLCVGLFIGLYTVWDAYAVSTVLIAPILIEYATALGRVTLLAPLAMKRSERVLALWRDRKKEVVLIAVLSPLAYILVLSALRFTPVIYVAPLRELSVLLNVLAGSILLGEGHLKERLRWSLLVLIGMFVLISA